MQLQGLLRIHLPSGTSTQLAAHLSEDGPLRYLLSWRLGSVLVARHGGRLLLDRFLMFLHAGYRPGLEPGRRQLGGGHGCLKSFQEQLPAGILHADA